jgi:hypothetical protein
MAEPHVLTGLIEKRAAIAGQIEHLQDKLRQLVINLDHIDTSMHIFDWSMELREDQGPGPRAPWEPGQQTAGFWGSRAG